VVVVERREKGLEAVLGYRFRQLELLRRALTHRSASAAASFSAGRAGAEQLSEDNERLEFLGDAVLGLLASEYLLAAFPDWKEGHLSRSRARIVNARSLGAAAKRLDLGEYLYLGRGEEKTGGREKPAVLADAFEAIVGAIYLDGGLEHARQFLKRALFDHTVKERRERLAESDFKSGLQEFLQGRGRAPASYRVVAERGPDHRKQFSVEVWMEGRRLAEGEGSSKKEAEQEAARRALEQLQAQYTHSSAGNAGT
jgi:ribonuclease-3